MLKELSIRKALGCLMLIVVLIHPLAAAARGECYSSKEYAGSVVAGVGGAEILVGGIRAAWTALTWLFSTDPKDCAGAIYYSPKRETFSAVYDRDSNLKAAEDGKEYCERKGGTCLWKTTFRKCAAVAKDDENRKWGIGQFSSAKESEQEALAVCKASGGKNCTITLSVCNSC